MAVPLVTINPPVTEWEESARSGLTITPERHTAIRYGQVAGDSVANFIKSILGYSRYQLQGTGIPGNAGQIVRFPPEKHPEFDWLYAKNIEFVRELGKPTPNGPFECLRFEDVELSIEYEDRPGVRLFPDEARPAGKAFSLDDWRYISMKKEYAVVSRIIPKGVLYFNTPAGPLQPLIVPELGVQIQAEFTLRLTWYQVPAVEDKNGVLQLPGDLETNIAAVVGRMNAAQGAADADKSFRGSPPQTLICMEPSRELRTMADGKPAFDIGYVLLGRGTKDISDFLLMPVPQATQDWTRLLNSDGNYSRVFRKGPAGQIRSIYDKEQFTRLFTV